MSGIDAVTPRPLALTMGEPAGIGGEIGLRAWRAIAPKWGAVAVPGEPPASYFVIDDPDRLAALSRQLDLGTPVTAIASPAEAATVFPKALPVLPLSLPEPIRPGRPNPKNATAVAASIERAVALVQAGDAAAVVTNPIHKETMYGGGFRFPGHTEFLGHLAGGTTTTVMMIVCPGLRVIPVTVHVPLARVPGALSTAAIVQAGRLADTALRRDFGIARPRLAVAGLNPHAGEGGAMGREEINVIAPAVAALRDAGIEAFGPAPADTLFHRTARETFDVALCMYHDQALIPVKTVDFENGVNLTLGLPYVRTSPDHGTAFDIAGSGRASAASLIAALHTAHAIVQRRRSVA